MQTDGKKTYNVYALYVACRLSATLLREPSLIGGGRLIAVLFPICRQAYKKRRRGQKNVGKGVFLSFPAIFSI